MEENQKYEMLAEGEVLQSSVMGVVPGEDFNIQLSTEYIRKQLVNSKDFKVLSIEETTTPDYSEDKSHIAELLQINISQIHNHTISQVATIEYYDTTYTLDISIHDISTIDLQEFSLGNQIEDGNIDEAMSQKNYVEVSMNFEGNTLQSFLFQLKVLNTIVPNASIVIDFSAYRLLSGKWLKMTAQSDVPPSPDYLYVLHTVYEEKEGKTDYWFHTHGLLRCGIVELEMLNFGSGPQQMYDLINNVVKMFLSKPIKENEIFTTGYDGMNINLIWLRHEEIMKDLPSTILGGGKDRVGKDNPHKEPSGILFGVEDGNFVSPEIYASSLAQNPIYYISNEETYRMSELAKERYTYFVSLFNKHAAKNKKSFFQRIFKRKEDDDKRQPFIAKLGLTVDNANSATEKEHLWFEVLSCTDNKIKGKLLNQPYWISSLNEGDINTYPIELLTDWMIYDSDGNRYTPDSIYQLLDI
jgi:uncharacterized protein YegJ (DUF2314 family)